MGKLYALSDLHISYKFNLEAFVKFFAALPSVNEPESQISKKVNDDDNLNSLVYDLNQEEHISEPAQPQNFTQDGLILAGDLGEKLEHLRLCFQLATKKFKKVWWVPGNHELYTLPGEVQILGAEELYGSVAGIRDLYDEADAKEDARLNTVLKGEAKYIECCRIASAYGVLTPEDEYVRWEYERDPGGPQLRAGSIISSPDAVLVCPIFTLYDYSFRPATVSRERALDWADEAGVLATDEVLLHPDPFKSREEWCEKLVRETEQRLSAAQSRGLPLVIINHWPLREDLVHIPLVPRFSLWCGTKLTDDWHKKFNAKVVVSGHLHVRRTDWKDGCRFEEVSLGYPRQWERQRAVGQNIGDMIRLIVPVPGDDEVDPATPRKTIWRGRDLL